MIEDKREQALRIQKIPPLIMKMTAPAITAMVVMSVYNMVDAIFMGMLGTNALGAATIGYPFFMLLSALGLMLGMGGASYQSILLGRKDKEGAERTIATVFGTAIILGIVTTIITVPLAKPIAYVFGATPALEQFSVDYIRILAYGSIFPIVSMCANNLLRAEGSAFQSLIGMGIGSIINIILDPIFMFALDMGVKGAAIATVLSQLIGAIILLSFYFRKKTVVHLHIKKFTPTVDIYKNIMKIGGPVFLQQFLTVVVGSLFNNKASDFGEFAIAAIGAFNRIATLGYVVLMGFGQGLQPVIGYNFGAKQFDRVKQAITFSLKVTTAFCIVVSAVSLIFPEALARMFSKDPLVIDTIIVGVKALGYVWPVMGFFFVAQILFQALGKAKQATTLAISRQGVFLITLILVLTPLFGLNGLMSSMAGSGLLSSILAFILFIPVYKEIKNKVE